MQTSLSSRRGVLRKSAIVVGAFLAGIGRTESAFGDTSTPNCTYFVRKCEDDEKKNCTFNLGWNGRNGGLCCECYVSADARARAISIAAAHNAPLPEEEWLEACTFRTTGVLCGFFDPTRAVAYEDPLSSPNYPCL